ncbi:MAG: VacJ family lipoprotein [Pseudohongiellaceae bacterium]
MVKNFKPEQPEQSEKPDKCPEHSRLLWLPLLFVLTTPAYAADPWQNSNRRIFQFNDFFDSLLVRPIAVIYSTALPRPVRQGIGNFFSNIDDINVFVNDLLQFKLDDALTDSGRFLINSTIGLAGVMDVASSFGMYKNEEDFGQTLGFWNVPAGPYVVLPGLGPSSVRDAMGLVLDTLFNPIQYRDEYPLRTSLLLIEEIDARASVLALDELISGDKYLFLREAYLERRDYLVADGIVENEFGAF